MADGALHTRLRQEFGHAAIESAPDGVPRAVPDTTQAVADLCGLAEREGLRVRIEGRGSWLPPDAPAQLAIATSRLTQVLELAPADLVVGVQAGLTRGALEDALAPHRARLPLDPPGNPDRSLGSILATGTAGPLRHGFGPVRDHLLGVTVVTGDGRVVRAGGRVVKNVAGYDLTRLEVGSFGAFGIITEAQLRLRALPAARRTLLAEAERDVLTRTARDFMEHNLPAAVLELCSPAATGRAGWTLLVELQDTESAVRASEAQVASWSEIAWVPLTAEQAAGMSAALARSALAGEITLRLGVLPDGLDETLDLIDQRLGTGAITAGAGRGTLRWSGSADLDPLRALRHDLARREIPLTLERAPWRLRSALGHFGEYREGIGGLVTRLRHVFDPDETFVVALGAGGGE
jgi:glycolate oxidase FAD binding subunit